MNSTTGPLAHDLDRVGVPEWRERLYNTRRSDLDRHMPLDSEYDKVWAQVEREYDERAKVWELDRPAAEPAPERQPLPKLSADTPRRMLTFDEVYEPANNPQSVDEPT